MKKFVFASVLLLTCSFLQAKIVYQADFSKGKEGWTATDLSTPSGFTGSIWTVDDGCCIKALCEVSGTPKAGTSIIASPSIDLSGYGKATLRFTNAMSGGEYSGSSKQIFVKVQSSSPYMVKDYEIPEVYTYDYTSEIDISDFSGSSDVVVKFYYSSSGTTGRSPVWTIYDATVIATTGTTVDVVWPDDFSDWSELAGETVHFTHPLTVGGHNYFRDALYLSRERLRMPEEVAKNFPNDSTDYYAIQESNEVAKLALIGAADLGSIRAGSVISDLTAEVDMEWEKYFNLKGNLTFDSKNERPTEVPKINEAKLIVCSANIENYFYWYGSKAYAGAKNEKKFQQQTTKILNALLMIDADLYCLVEVGDGQDAINFLTDSLNKRIGDSKYAYIDDGSTYSESQKGAYIYRTDKLEPYGTLYFPYASGTYHLRELIQGFKEKSSGEKFVVSINHFKAKGSGDTNSTRMKNAQYLVDGLNTCLTSFDDPDQLLLGDFNAYSKEEPVQFIIGKGFVDELKRFSPDDYSYNYESQIGYLDHAFTTQSMSIQVVGAMPLHLNADEYSDNGYAYNDNTDMYRYADHDPLIIGLDLGRTKAIEDEGGNGGGGGKEEVTTYTVRFFDDPNLGSKKPLKEEEVEEGEDATPPTPPTHEGYEFVDWDRKYTNVKKDIDVYAEYKAVSAVDDINADKPQVKKVIENGSIYIIRDNKRYTLLGIEL